MKSDLFINQQTLVELDNFVSNPAHSILIEAKLGAGKATLAQQIAHQLLGLNNQSDPHPAILNIEPLKNTISIDQARLITKFVKLKTTGERDIRRVIVINNADLMTIEAQNALLKNIEEPPSDTVIIMTVSQKTKLLPTIRSRTQFLRLKPLTKVQLEEYFSNRGHETSDITAAYHAANGQIGLMIQLLEDSENPKLEQLNNAKKVLGLTTLDRLVYADELAKQKEGIEDFIKALVTTCQAGMKQAASKSNNAQTKRWHHSFKQAVVAESMLTHNPNTKLLLTDLMLSL